MPVKKKTAPDKEPRAKRSKDLFQKRQTQIINKATRLFLKKGYAQTSMRDISRATGIDISNLYYFIKNKEEILFLVFDMLHKPALEVFEKHGIMHMDDPVEQLKAVINGLIASGYNYESEILLLYRESNSLPKRMLKSILERESLVVTRLEEILKKGKARGVFQFDDAAFTANIIVYQLSLYPLRKWNMRKYSKKELIGLMQRQILKMIMA